MTNPSSPGVRPAARFQGRAASSRSQNVAGAATVGLLALAAVGGFLADIPALIFFAIGAGSGYSLSGSV